MTPVYVQRSADLQIDNRPSPNCKWFLLQASTYPSSIQTTALFKLQLFCKRTSRDAVAIRKHSLGV